MAKKSRKAHRRSPVSTAHQKPPNLVLAAWREIHRQITRSPETVLLVLAVVHIVFGLGLLAAMGFAINPQAMTQQSPVFGAETPEEQRDTHADLGKFNPPVGGTIAYGLMTVVLWAAFAILRRRIEARQRRFLTLLLTPGTLFFVVSAVRLVFLLREA